MCIRDSHVVLGVDRAGLVGEDGETHHGVFDVGFLDTVPGMTVLAPASYAELRGMLDYAVNTVKGPAAIRYPRGGEGAWQGSWDGEAATLLQEGEHLTSKYLSCPQRKGGGPRSPDKREKATPGDHLGRPHLLPFNSSAPS